MTTRPSQLSGRASRRAHRGNEQLIGLLLMVATSAIAFWDLFALATNLAH
ncbi:MAG TPA: hypothetical protein VL984_15095 [Acidimicrobiales bacterium]|nr:hypothetical protein [Acidimicrobiales bacterium]